MKIRYMVIFQLCLLATLLIFVAIVSFLDQALSDNSEISEEILVELEEVKLPLTISITTLEEPIITIQEPTEPQVAKLYWGRARITAYCSCQKCCGDWALNRPKDVNTGQSIVVGAAGTPLQSLHSVATPPILPFGTVLQIEGINLSTEVFVVEDRIDRRASKLFNDFVIDVYFDSHEECWEYIKAEGTEEYHDVYIISNED